VTEGVCIVCAHIFADARPVSLVVHHADGMWQFVCGGYDHPPDCSDFETVGISHLINRQPNLVAVSDLELGWLAEWRADSWQKMAHDD